MYKYLKETVFHVGDSKADQAVKKQFESLIGYFFYVLFFKKIFLMRIFFYFSFLVCLKYSPDAELRSISLPLLGTGKDSTLVKKIVFVFFSVHNLIFF